MSSVVLTPFMLMLCKEIKQGEESEKALLAVAKKFAKHANDSSDDGLMDSDEDFPQAKVPKKKKNNNKRPTTKKKDPNAPKRPLSAYFMFAQAVRADIKASMPQLTLGELSKEMGSQWRDLSAEDKQPYVAAAEKNKALYKEEMKAYEAAKPATQ